MRNYAEPEVEVFDFSVAEEMMLTLGDSSGSSVDSDDTDWGDLF